LINTDHQIQVFLAKNVLADAMHEDWPLRFPRLFLEALVDGLRDGRLHQVHVADDVRSEHVTKVIVKPATTQALYTHASRTLRQLMTSRRHGNSGCSSPWCCCGQQQSFIMNKHSFVTFRIVSFFFMYAFPLFNVPHFTLQLVTFS